MKIKKIITAVLFSILVISSNRYNSIHAEKEIVEEVIHEHVPEIKKSSISKDESTLQENAETYLQNKYGTNRWVRGKHNTTSTVSNGIPIEMQYTNQYDTIKAICQELQLKTKYGGCGPIAMIGMADFFSRYYGYKEIINNPDDGEQQKELIKEILRNIATYEVANSAGTGKETLSLPGDCVDGFNKVMKNHNLENTIQASDMGFFGVSKREKILKIKEQIDKGLPVTVYTARAGEGYLGNHYVNVYGYEEWHGENQNGKSISHTMLLFRMNWGNGYNKPLYMDSDILGGFITGIIYYDVTYKYQPLPDILFQELKNQNGQGQYFNEVVESPFTIKKYEFEMSFMSRRLRCSYLNQGYFVLSANRDNHDTAYLELEFEEDVRKVGLDLYQWSTKERFSSDSSLRLEYFDESTNEWKIARDIFIFGLPLKENSSPGTIVTLLPKPSKKMRIIVENKGIITDRNKGRIVISCIDVYLDTYNQVYKPHEHIYNNKYKYIDEDYHWAYCVCGQGHMEKHTITSESNACIYCKENDSSHGHIWNMENYDENKHKVYCDCGEFILEKHSFTYETIDGNTHRYYCECGEEHIESHIIDTSTHIHGVFQCIKCNETIEITHDYTHGYENNGEDGHLAYCWCGDFVTKEHTWIIQNGKKVCQYCDYEEYTHHYIYEEYDEVSHKGECSCGDTKIEFHDVGPIMTGHCTAKCQYCGADVIILHIFKDHYEQYDENEHGAYCICGDVIYRAHTYNENGVCIYCYHETN